MNKVKDFAVNFMGLEWDEEKNESQEFNIVGHNFDTYKFVRDCLRDGDRLECDHLIPDILILGFEPIKTIKKPKYGQAYYLPNIFSLGNTAYHTWTDSDLDADWLKSKLICFTKEEALELAQEIRDFVKNRE
jgi:hypothetical protein